MGFTPNPFDGFIGQPRTTAEAIDAGWQQISNDCSEGARFLFIFRPRSDQVWSSRLTRGEIPSLAVSITMIIKFQFSW